jgi:hypothetical protein
VVTTSRQELVYVVVVSVVYAVVDVVERSAPSCPLTITYPSLSEARHPTTIDKQPVAEVEVLCLYPMLTGCYAVNDALVLAWEGETIG